MMWVGFILVSRKACVILIVYAPNFIVSHLSVGAEDGIKTVLDLN